MLGGKAAILQRAAVGIGKLQTIKMPGAHQSFALLRPALRAKNWENALVVNIGCTSGGCKCRAPANGGIWRNSTGFDRHQVSL